MQPTKPLRAVIYCRISEKDEAFDKVDAQARRCAKLALDAGYSVVADPFIDDGISAYSGVERPSWKRLREQILLGRFDVVLAVAPDRFSRNNEEMANFQNVCAVQGVRIHTLTAGLVDPSQPMQSAMAAIGGVLAEMESALKRERLQARFNEERSQGRTLWGPRSFGYNIRTREVPVITVREDEAVELRGAYRRIIGGATLYSVMSDWNERGIPTAGRRNVAWTYSSVRALLLNPRNAGLLTHDRKTIGPGAWEPIVDEDTWRQAERILRRPDRRSTDRREPRWLSAGIAACGVCGQPMRSASVRATNGDKVGYYRCASRGNAGVAGPRHPAIRIAELDQAVSRAVVRSIVFAPRAVSGALGDADAPDFDAHLAQLERREQRFLAALEDLEMPYPEVRDGLVSARREIDALNAARTARQAADLQSQLLDQTHREMWVGATVSIASTSGQLEEVGHRFHELPLGRRRALVRQHVAITVHPGRRADRVKVDFLLVPSLNDEGDDRL